MLLPWVLRMRDLPRVLGHIGGLTGSEVSSGGLGEVEADKLVTLHCGGHLDRGLRGEVMLRQLGPRGEVMQL